VNLLTPISILNSEQRSFQFVHIKHAIPVVVAGLALLATVLPSAAASDTVGNARGATSIYNDPSAALAGGYELLTDAQGLACIEQPGVGAMGVHFVKGALIQSGTIDAARPQALVYEPQPNGQLRLAAVEYVVFQAAWDTSHGEAPTLFGEKFMLTPAGNRYGLPAFYSLHAWLWKNNPSGMFQMWNPQVHCGVLDHADQTNVESGNDPEMPMSMDGM
jgi:hypothetical protein